MNTQAGDFYLSNEDADRIAASAGLSASEYDALAKAASMEQQQRNQEVVQKDIDNKMQILANLNAASRMAYKPAPIGFVPMGMTPVGEQARIPVSASERLDYATKARELQQEIQRNLSEAGMIQGPVITGPLTPTPPTGSEQPTPTPAPAAPEAAPASKEKEKPQYDPFAEFNRTNEIKQKFYDIALAELSQLPVSQRAAGLKLVGEIWNSQGPKIPSNMAVPLIDSSSGKPLEGYALIGGKVEKIEKPKVEEDGRSVIGYEGKAPTQGEAIKFREQVSDINSGVSALDELIQLGRKGSSLSPTDRARAQNLARMIQGKFRVEIVGPGAVTENDRNVLEDVVASPLDIFRLSDVPTLLMDMKSRILSAKNEKAFQLGLTPTGQKQQQQSAPGGVLIYNQSTKSFAPAR
jgi:hypothetical protein